MRTWIRFALPILTLLATDGGAIAQSVGDPFEGSVVAHDVCIECHAVDPEQLISPNPGAPAFKEIANLHGMSFVSLNVLLRTPHGTMPLFVLKDREIDDLSAYILSMRE